MLQMFLTGEICLEKWDCKWVLACVSIGKCDLGATVQNFSN